MAPYVGEDSGLLISLPQEMDRAGDGTIGLLGRSWVSGRVQREGDVMRFVGSSVWSAGEPSVALQAVRGGGGLAWRTVGIGMLTGLGIGGVKGGWCVGGNCWGGWSFAPLALCQSLFCSLGIRPLPPPGPRSGSQARSAEWRTALDVLEQLVNPVPVIRRWAHELTLSRLTARSEVRVAEHACSLWALPSIQN